MITREFWFVLLTMLGLNVFSFLAGRASVAIRRRHETLGQALRDGAALDAGGPFRAPGDKAPSPPPEVSPARFDPMRLPRHIIWFLISATEKSETRDTPFGSTRDLTWWGWIVVVWILLLAVTALCAGIPNPQNPHVPVVGGVALGVLVALALLRVWLRFAMALDDHDSRTAWEKRFE